ncbi:hypothetical protein LPJ66_006956, partial [Kickxella alabastrina]
MSRNSLFASPGKNTANKLDNEPKMAVAAATTAQQNTQGLMAQLKALEAVRRDELTALETINSIHSSIATTTGLGDVSSRIDGSSSSRNTEFGDSYAAASALALQEKQVADAALEYVNIMLAQLSEPDAASELLHQRMRKQRLESRSSSARRRSRSRDRSVLRSADAEPGERRAGTVALSKSQSLEVDHGAGSMLLPPPLSMPAKGSDAWDRHSRSRERDRD